MAVLQVASVAAPAPANEQGSSVPAPTDALSGPLTVRDALMLAMHYSPELKATAGSVDAAAGRAWQSGRWSNPSLHLSVEEWPLDNGGSFSDAKQTIGVSQTLPWPGKLKYDRHAGKAGVRLSESELALRRTQVARDVKVAFHEVVVTENSLQVGVDLLSIAQESAQAARKRVDAGAATYQEQLRAEIELERARNEVASLEVDVTNAREVLFTLLGRMDLLQSPLTASLNETCQPELIDTPNQHWQTSHPSIQTADAAIRVAEFEVRRAKLDPYPDITASVDGGRMGETDQSIIEFGLSIPLPLLDTSKGRKSEADANLTVAESQLESVRLQLTLNWNRALQRYRAAGEQAAAFRERILPKTEEALRLVETGFEQGRFEFIDLLDTQRTFAETRLAYQKKLLELNTAQADLEALLNPVLSTNLTTLDP